MAEITPIGLKQNASGQVHDIFADTDKINNVYFKLADWIASVPGNTITLGTDGLLFVPNCCKDGYTRDDGGSGSSGGSNPGGNGGNPDSGSGSDGNSGGSSGSDSNSGGGSGSGSSGGGSSGGSGGASCDCPSECNPKGRVYSLVSGREGNIYPLNYTDESDFYANSYGATGKIRWYATEAEVLAAARAKYPGGRWIPTDAGGTNKYSYVGGYTTYCSKKEFTNAARGDGYFEIEYAVGEEINPCIKFEYEGCAYLMRYVATEPHPTDPDNKHLVLYTLESCGCAVTQGWSNVDSNFKRPPIEEE